jgi:hypothetical protein
MGLTGASSNQRARLVLAEAKWSPVRAPGAIRVRAPEDPPWRHAGGCRLWQLSRCSARAASLAITEIAGRVERQLGRPIHRGR